MKKRLRNIFVCTTMILLITGCGKETVIKFLKGSEGKNYKEFITVDVYDEFANYQGMQNGWFAKVVKDKFNMELNIIAKNVTGGGDTIFQTRSATGNLGDLIIFSTVNGRLNDLVNSGLILDCTDLIKEKDVMKKYGNAVAKTNELVDADGIYAFPNSISSGSATEASEELDPTFGPYIRWDYYKKLGYPLMENLDDFLDVLEDMQNLARKEEACDDIYAISCFRAWDLNMMNNAKQLVCMYGYDELGFVLSKADGSDYQNIIDKDSLYIEALRFLNEANQRGLVDPDSILQSYDTWLDKYRKGKVLYSPWPWVGQSMFNTEENKADGKGFQMAAIKNMQIVSFGCWPEGDSAQVIAIGANTKDPQRLADFIDWLYSPEGMELNGQANGAAGPKGLTWEIEKDKKPILTEFGRKALPNNQVEVPEEYGGGYWNNGVSALNFRTLNLKEIDPNTGVGYNYLCWESTKEKNKTALDLDWKEQMEADTAMEYLEKNNMILIAPGANYSTPEEDSNITTVRERCKSVVIETSWRMIFASSNDFDKLLKELQDTTKALGYDDVYQVDLKNAKDQAEARNITAKKY